jgi:hypothetical protein
MSDSDKRASLSAKPPSGIFGGDKGKFLRRWQSFLEFVLKLWVADCIADY